MNREEQSIPKAVKTALFDIIMGSTCHCMFFQKHWMYNTKRGPCGHLWMLGESDESIFHKKTYHSGKR